MHGSSDPDPHPDPYQNVTDPQHWVPDIKIIKLPGNMTGSRRKGCDPRQPESLEKNKALYIPTGIYFYKKNKYIINQHDLSLVATTQKRSKE
jgi:hypothetical protein